MGEFNFCLITSTPEM